MKKVASLFVAGICLCTFSLVGCSSGENQVVEAPPEMAEEQPAIEGMSDEDYDKAMEEDMNQ